MKNTMLRIAVGGVFALPLIAQATIFQFNATLNGVNENPDTTSLATGVATLSYNDKGTISLADDVYNFTMSVFGLSGGTDAGTAASDYHIHGAATLSENASVRVSLKNAPFVSLNSGSTLLVGGNNVTAPTALFTTAATAVNAGHPAMSFLAMMQAQLAYVNVHTVANPGGDVRGQLIQVAAIPEPETYALMLAGLGLVGWVAGRRRKVGA